MYAVFAPRLPIRSYFAKSLALAAVSWLLIMVVFMPLGGVGLFGLERSPVVPVAMLVLNLAYWLVLGMSYYWLTKSGSQPDQVKT